LVKVVCDTSFLVLLANKRIKNISTIDTEIGQIQFIVPKIVEMELRGLCNDIRKKQEALSTLEYIKNFNRIIISGSSADYAIISYVKEHGGIVATIDSELKARVKESGGSILSLSNNKIVLEPSKI